MEEKKIPGIPKTVPLQVKGEPVSAGSLNKVYSHFNDMRNGVATIDGNNHARAYFVITEKNDETKICKGQQLFNNSTHHQKPDWRVFGGKNSIFHNILDEDGVTQVGDKVWCFFRKQDGLWHVSTSPALDYLAYLPCDGKPLEGWEPDVSMKPPSRVVCLFELKDDDSTENEIDPEVVPVLDEKDKPVRVRVYNVYKDEIPPNKYFRIQKLSTGYWVAEDPTDAFAGHAEGFRDTPVEEEVTEGDKFKETNVHCGGYCFWRWDGKNNVWNELEDNCAVETTTTTTPDPTIPPEPPKEDERGPRPTCPCPIDGSEDTDPEDPEPEPALCKCVPPEECGKEHGEITRTQCVPATDHFDIKNCEPCDCATTTTRDPYGPDPNDPGDPNGGDESTDCPKKGCAQVWMPTLSGMGWVQQINNCKSFCPCPFPTTSGTGVCQVVWTPCTRYDPGGGNPTYCNGYCNYWWTGLGWIMSKGRCFSSGTKCSCREPSEDGDDCGDVVRVPCTITVDPNIPPGDPGGPGGGNPTDPDGTNPNGDPCEDCYNDPNTPDGECDGPCKFKWVDNPINPGNFYWTLLESKCATSCPCYHPSYDGTHDGETAWTSCSEIPPEEQTTTTTTPAPPLGRCCYRDFSSANYFCVDTTEELCDGFWNGGAGTCPPGSDTTPVPITTCLGTVTPTPPAVVPGACCYSIGIDAPFWVCAELTDITTCGGGFGGAVPYPNMTCSDIWAFCHEQWGPGSVGNPTKSGDTGTGLVSAIPPVDNVTNGGFSDPPGSTPTGCYWSIGSFTLGDDGGGTLDDIGVTSMTTTATNMSPGQQFEVTVTVTNNTGLAWAPCNTPGPDCFLYIEAATGLEYKTATIQPTRIDAATIPNTHPPVPPLPPPETTSEVEWDFSIPAGGIFTVVVTYETKDCTAGSNFDITAAVSRGRNPSTLTIVHN